ncbi:MAG: hypothetical protein CUN55_09080 [Phototrophicales bacterium]|nr:MAG: hypothetical protein CUN55_09080 [Phototrophicales bacterium]
MFLLTPILILGDMFEKLPDLRVVGVFGIIPPLVITIAQMELYRDWWQRLLYFPAQFIVGAAIVLSNTIAVFKAFHKPNIEREFKRTPKFRIGGGQAQNWVTSRYALKIDATTFGELVLAVYALFGFIVALDRLPVLAPYMLTYAISFAVFALWNIWQNWQMTRQQQQLIAQAKK